MSVSADRKANRSLRSLLLVGTSLAACFLDNSTGPRQAIRVDQVVVTATSLYLAPGDTVRMIAQVLDSAGRDLQTEPITWSSSSPLVAHIDATGLVTADSVGATTITATAGGKSGHTDVTVQVTTLCACTRILDSTSVQLISFNDTTGIYIFQIIRGPAPDIDSGTIIVGAQGQGYLRRVLHKDLAGSQLTLKTTEAYVEEAVQDGGFENTAFTDAASAGALREGQGGWVGPWTTVYMAPGVHLTNAGFCCTLDGLNFNLKLGGKVAGILDFTVKQGRIDFLPRIDVGARIRWFSLKELHAILRGDLGLYLDNYEMKLAVTGSGNVTEKYSKESQKFIEQQRPYVTFIGPMPVLFIFTKKISLELTPTVTASTVFSGRFKAGVGVAAGVQWIRGSGWQPVSGATSLFDATAPQFQGVEGAASIRIAVVPELNVLVYGVAGPYVNLDPYAEADATAALGFTGGTPTSFDWETKVVLGLNLNIGAKFSLFGKKDLLQTGFTIPLIRPRSLIRNFSDGPLTVRTITTGADLPPTIGLRLRPAFLDTLPLLKIRDLSHDNVDAVIAPNGTQTLTLIRSGTSFPHQVMLTSLAGNCYDSLPNPDTLAIASSELIALGGTAADTLFHTHCIPLGDLLIRTTTTGPDQPPRYAVTVKRQDTTGVGRADQPELVVIPGGLAAADTVLEDFIPLNPRRGGNGRLDATLNGVRRNCAVARPATNQMVILSGDTVVSQYMVTCVPLGHLTLRAGTIDLDPAPISDTIRYTPLLAPAVAVDTVPAQPAPTLAGDSALVSGLVPLYNASGATGRYTVTLGSVPNRCSDISSFSRLVTVFPGDTARADFALRCVERLQVITRTTGPGTDPSGYDIVVTPAIGIPDTVHATVNDTVGIAGVPAGDITVSLADVEPSCIAPLPVNRFMSGRDSTLATFQVSCPAPAPVTGLAATRVDTNRVDIAWNPAASGTGVVLYRIYRDGLLRDSSTTPSFSDLGLPAFTLFSYQVSPVNSAGLEGAKSAALQVRTLDATPPSAPVALSATPVSGSRINLAWQPATDPETGVTQYLVYREGVEIGRTPIASFADTGLTPSTAYSYEVAALNGQGLVGPKAGPVTATTLDVTPPSAPSGLAATAVSSTQIDLGWNAASDPESGIQGYNVYRNGVRVATALTTSFSDPGRTPNTSYSYTVTAVNGAGLEGAPSQALVVTTLPDQTPPGAPGGLRATPVSGTQVNLNWTAAGDPESGILRYRIYRNGVLTDSTTGLGYADVGLTPGTTYTYEVSALNGAGLEGPRSQPVTVQTSGDLTPPSAPSGLSGRAVSDHQIDLDWAPATDPESGIQGYNIYRNGTLAGHSVTTGFSDPGLAPNTAYVYTVTAVNGAGIEGPPSQAVTVSTLPDQTPPSAPNGLSGTAVSDHQVDLGWTPATDPESGIQGYNIYRSGALVGQSVTAGFSDPGLAPNTAYVYTVTAVNGAGIEGPPSQAVTVSTLQDQTPPSAPSGLSATAVSGTQVDLAWSAAGDAESGIALYRIYRDGALVDSTTGLAFADAGLTPATTYSYEVSAVNGAGLEGPRSQPATATTWLPTTGDLVVTTATTGSNIPAGYTVQIEAGSIGLNQPIAASGSASFSSLLPQSYVVRLRTVPGNCQVSGPNPRTVVVSAGAVATTTFPVSCR